MTLVREPKHRWRVLQGIWRTWGVAGAEWLRADKVLMRALEWDADFSTLDFIIAK